VVFENIAFDFIFAVLYGFIHLALKIATDGKSKSTYTKSSICHWILLGFIVAISIGDFLTYILGKSREWVTLQVANWTLRWVCSWEISAWAIFAFIKAKKLPSAVKVRHTR
jgi:hypothetical protein